MNVGQTPVESLEFPERNNSTYDDGDIPEIDLPETADVTPSIPEECSGKGIES